MIVKVSDWLISTVKRYRPMSTAATMYVGNVYYTLYVTLIYAGRDPSADVVKVVWKFDGAKDVKLRDSAIDRLDRLDGRGALFTGLNYVIQSDFTWGEVYLQEEIKVVGAV